MATFRDLLAAAKAEIIEIDTADAQSRIQAGGVLVLDVREPDEYEQGALPNVLRGVLEENFARTLGLTPQNSESVGAVLV
jgi:rhodanese-related sulfurtransferase